MPPSFMSVTLLAGIAAIAMTVPAAASLAISGSTHTRPLQATQYAQDFSHGSGPVDYGYKSKKSAKSKKHTTGQAKSTKPGTTKTDTAK
jgi:hypothetical protein